VYQYVLTFLLIGFETEHPDSALYSRPEWRVEIQQDVSESYVLHLVPEKGDYSVVRVRHEEISTMDLAGQCGA
jgi:hypothetical protein